MLDLSVDPEIGVPADVRRRLRTEVARMIRAAACRDRRDPRADYEVSLRLVGDAQIHALNRGYRGKDRPTDVLAFAQREGPGAALHPGLLGDIVISVDTARRQARRGLYRELMHLASHGLCHLLGYDHRDDAEEAEMNARAAALRTEARRRGPIRPA
ncbi:MAG TPA: rRNA maturation RNase YbeY [Kofleriaceae bacterium]|jgi:probable rRNA maturation factor